MLKLCSHDWDALEVHALYDGDAIAPWETVLTIEGRLHALRPSRDGVPRRARAADARLDERAARGRGRRAEADPLLPGAARPLAGADRRRLCGARRRRDRRLDGRAVVVVGRPRDRHGAARADRVLRRRHGRGGAAFRRRGARGHERRRARRLRERLGAHVARGRASPRAEALGRPARHVGEASSTARSGTRWATSIRAA